MPTLNISQPGQVFLSYSHTDRPAAMALQLALEQQGLTVFRDADKIRVGERWMSRLQEALQGCSAFVLLVGRDGVQRWVGAEAEVALNRHLSPHEENQRLPIFPVLLEHDAKPESLPPFLALFQSSQWTPTEPLPQALIEAIQARAIRYDEPPVFEGCPFLGLNAFSRNDACLFFGRRKETLEALACLGDQQQSNPESMRNGGGDGYKRWLQIEGNSGAGKSSLVNAGLLPMIERGGLWARTGFEHWQVLGPMMPGKDPLTKLAEVMEQALMPDAAQHDLAKRKEEWLKNDDGLALALRGFKRPNQAFLLIVDQFEELFSFAEDASRKRFDTLLAQALADPECPLFLISTVRADFLDRLEQLPSLQKLYNSHCRRYFLPTMSEHGLREAIEQRARLARLDVSEVTAAILKDARDEIGALPLVENALFTLWRQRQDHRLSGKTYIDQGGIAGMLSTQADALLERIDRSQPHGRRGALELLLRLTRINDEGRHSRQRVRREEAVDIAGEGQAGRGERIVQMLSGERPADVPVAAHNGHLRLITTSVEQARGYVDLIHETLIRARGKDEASGKRFGYWPTLYEYIEANRDRDLHRQQLQFQTRLWLNSRGLGRWWHLAGWRELRLYRRLRLRQDSPEGRFLRWSRWTARTQLGLLLALSAFVGQSYWWTRINDLPLDAMLMQQRFRLGYAPLPELVDIPKGSFVMGEQDRAFLKENIQDKYLPNLGVPGKPVTLEQDFQLGKHEVTYEQFDYYVWEQGGLAYPMTAKGGRGQRPVVNVTWDEAHAYTQWLGKRTHQNCRLPNEAEWEYAARAHSYTAYPWGNEVRLSKNGREAAMANCYGCGSEWDNRQSAPVGSFPPNAFGLYDTSGNVWEWSCSLWRDKFDGSEQQCAGPDNRELRAVRGGAWNDATAFARPPARLDFNPGSRDGSVGFRVLCSSPIL